MNKTIIGLMVGVALMVIIAGCAREVSVTNFEECVAAGNPVMESFPEQCRANGQTFVNEKQQVPVSEPMPVPGSSVNETVVEPSGKMRVMPSNEPLPPAVQAGKDFVEAEANSSAIVLSAHEVIWPDHCMGIIDPAATCLAEPLKGYNLTIYAGESEYEIHTDENGTVVRKAGVKHTGALAI